MLERATFGDHDWIVRAIRFRLDALCLDCAHDVHSLDYFAEHDVLSIQMAGRSAQDEEL